MNITEITNKFLLFNELVIHTINNPKKRYDINNRGKI